MVVNAEDYYFCSALNYAGLDNDLEVEVVFMGVNIDTDCRSAPSGGEKHASYFPKMSCFPELLNKDFPDKNYLLVYPY